MGRTRPIYYATVREVFMEISSEPNIFKQATINSPCETHSTNLQFDEEHGNYLG